MLLLLYHLLYHLQFGTSKQNVMASITLLLKDNKVNEKGEMPIYLRIIKGRKAKFISLGYKVHPDLWDAGKQRVKKGYQNSTRVNAFLAKKVADAEGIAVTMETTKKYVSSRKIKEGILGGTPESIVKYIERYRDDLKAKGKMGTHDKVVAVLAKLNEYLGSGDLTFDEMDVQFLRKYEQYLREKKSNGINTIHSNLKIFRKVFNDAVREELIEPHLNPFLKYKLSTEKGKKEYLTDDEIKAIDELKLTEGSVMFHHRNIYIFAIYAGGIRISDILQLRWGSFDGTHLNLTTQKTKEIARIKLPTRALQILEQYAGYQPEKINADYIFPFLKNEIKYTPELLFKAISSNTAYANKNLKLIATKAKVEKKISFHTSRHTFATRALRKGMRIEYVSKIMTHASIKTTQVYTKIINEELDSAMDIFNE